MAAEHIRKWRVGDVEIARIVELYGFEDHLWMLLKDAKPEFMQQYEWLRPHFATPDGRMIMNFQCFVLRSRGKSVMIDTCIGSDRQREYEVFCNLKTSFLEDLRAAGFPHEAMDAVLCTHLHFDHVGWNTRQVDGKWVPTFPKARYLFGRKEYEHWCFLRETHGYHDLRHVEECIDPIEQAGLMELIDPDFQLTDELSLIPTPGHTPGHVSVLIRSRGEEAVITGDMLHHPIQLEVPGLEANFDMDKPTGAQTRKDFVNRFADSGTLVIGSHFAEPTAGHIVSNGASWRLKTE
jgi:glyoxylase-like metal-dependent hydrolase (beta-lactamase superfamily II)